MIPITLVLLLSYCSMYAMELPRDQQQKNNTKEQDYTILPSDLCKKIGVYKSEIDGPAIEAAEMIKMSCPIDNALHRMSATWNSLIPQTSLDGSHHFWDHQLIYELNHVGDFTFSSMLHFDIITTHESNKFIFAKPRREGEHQSIRFKAMFDGPNNDGGPGAGVVLVADSYFGMTDRKTRFYLFKLRAIDKKDYSGAQERDASAHEVPPLHVYQSVLKRFKLPQHEQDYYSKDQHLDFCALAPHKRGIIASHTTYYTPYLNIFEYEHDAHTPNRAAPDQSFRVKMLVSEQVGARFIRLAWIYGRTLLGLTRNDELYVLALDEHEGKTSIRLCPQKINKKITNFCLARPHNHHVVFLCDDQKNIYYVNLKHRTRKGAIALNLLTRDGVTLSNGLPRVDRMWAYEDRLALLDTEKMLVWLFTLNQQDWTGQRVNTVLQAKKIVKVFPWMEEPYDECRA